MKAIIEMVYKIVKNYMVAQATDTGNQAFVARLNEAFRLAEGVWKEINAPQPKDNTLKPGAK